MACSSNTVYKYVVVIQPGCYFSNADNFVAIQNVYRILHNGTPVLGWGSSSGAGSKLVFPGIVSISSAINAGEMNSLEIPESDRKAKGTDGIRNLPELDLVVKVQDNIKSRSVRPNNRNEGEFFADWWTFRNSWDFNVYIYITNRAYKALYGYKYEGCSIGKFENESMGINDVKQAQVNVKLLPYDIKLIDCLDNSLDDTVGASVSIPSDPAAVLCS